MDEMYGIGNYQDVARNASVNVGVANVEISPKRNDANPRKMIVIRNNSAAAASIITINLGAQSATANTGIVLRQYESFTDADDSGYKCFQGTINAICADANGNLVILER